ncbi:hypothetical protein L228DRAFT_251163 [Xylona heveae TC161]|uniref:Phosphatidate phosphatase APP1 catalytic domain-containing protein n=1 Tax=Xylona heveae (strain CBS 132557 / TC161) TaxID=1328760 RepID=A0A164ZUI7_XYLHT|nr:hypothetical protein L228DRAFT_251163 [Xylona heveae TC161]KZF19544.1 hypothetical protein L228DRAFT_251163 [Xylona heveae TC161]
MTQPGSYAGIDGRGSLPPDGRDKNTRRRKLAGYLKAANELRQSYQQAYIQRSGRDRGSFSHDDDAGIPGAFPEVDIVRHGDEEMVLFPSYARRHVKSERRRPEYGSMRQPTGVESDQTQISGTGDAQYWHREWEKHEDETAVVDVDVRGWIYSPHRGPMTRKNRILIGLARQLSGVPAPSGRASAPSSRSTSPVGERRDPLMEADLVTRAAETILKKGEGEAEVAKRGGYSETPRTDDSASARTSRNPSPVRLSRTTTGTSAVTESDPQPGIVKRASWNQPSNMNPEQLAMANAHLMARLKPFLTNPLSGAPITVFFYDENTSRSRTVMTDDSGHFSVRAALDFVPKNVRVLASEDLSAMTEVRITEPVGVSVISDIDDTIKHSGVASGAREMFRNTFIRELDELSIDGVKEWYSKLAEMGVKMHYVSNSPWQLYPLLVSYFAKAGLPPGSFHLKAYTGMLQGIFEPVAERKKSALEKILKDFPKRKFILVGDSGEADLEVYTDVALAHPGRVLGVFIRDVTTPQRKHFFDSSVGPVGGDSGGSSSHSRSTSDGPVSRGDALEMRPALPPRTPRRGSEVRTYTSPLIDLDEEEDDYPQHIENVLLPEEPPARRPAYDHGLEQLKNAFTPIKPKPAPPPRPTKPAALRSNSEEAIEQARLRNAASENNKKGVPPPPPKPRQYSGAAQPASIGPSQTISRKPAPDSSANSHSTLEEQGYGAVLRQKVSSAYNADPSTMVHSAEPTPPPPPPPRPATNVRSSTASAPYHTSSSSSPPAYSSRAKPPPPTPPPRRTLTSYPAAAAHFATSRLASGWNASTSSLQNLSSGHGAEPRGFSSRSNSFSDPNLPHLGGAGGGNGSGNNSQEQYHPVSKKVELWNRRLARAQKLLERQDVILRTWREGSDVMDDAIKLVEHAQKFADLEARREAKAEARAQAEAEKKA